MGTWNTSRSFDPEAVCEYYVIHIVKRNLSLKAKQRDFLVSLFPLST